MPELKLNPNPGAKWLRASLLLLALLPVLPLFAPWHLMPLASFHIEWLAVICGLLACLMAMPVLMKGAQVAMPRMVMLPLALMAFLASQAQLLPQVVVQHAQMAMSYLLWAALLMALAGLLAEKCGRIAVSFWLAGGLAAAAIYSTGSELVFRLHGVPVWWGGLGQANNYGDLLALGLASALYLLTAVKPARRIYVLMLTAMIVLGLSFTSSRSVWLYWLAMALMVWRWRPALLKVLIPAFVLYMLLQGLWSTGLLPVQQTAVERLYQEVGGSSQRLHLWNVAWQLFLQAPWLGQGFGQFDWAYFNAGQHIPELGERVEHAHNLILHLLAELGVFPVLVLLVLLGFWLRQIVITLEAATDEKETDDVKAFQLWLLMLTAVLGIHSLLEYPLWYAEFLGIAAVILALGDVGSWPIRLGKASAACASGLLIVSIVLAGMHEWHYIRMERALHDFSSDKTQTKFEQVLSICQQASVQAPLLTPYVAMVFSSAGDPADKRLRSEMALLTDASFRFFPNKNMVYRQAELQALNGLREESRQTLKLALTAYPNERGAFLNQLKLLNASEQPKVEHLRKMVEVE